MFNPRTIITNINLGGLCNFATQIPHICNEAKALRIDNVLIVSKLSRYEYEKRKYNQNDKQLEKILRNRGTNFEKLITHYDLHKNFEKKVVSVMRDMGINVEVVNRFTYKDELFEAADIIVPVGGDGTFLLAASRVLDNKKPVVGFNSDPSRSEGYLCLPKRYSNEIQEAIERLQNGNFHWLLRSRIRTTFVVSEETNLVPTYLHDIDGETANTSMKGFKILPCLALNEVFIGETLSAKVSHLQMRLNGSTENTNIKCSGICVATGTGSTSWHLSINRLPVQSVAELLRLLNIHTTEEKESLAAVLADKYNKNLIFDPGVDSTYWHKIINRLVAQSFATLPRLLDMDATTEKDSISAILTKIYNKNLLFAPDEQQMGYTIRDLISAGVWPQPKGIKSRGFARKIEMKSNCFCASLVIDGGVSFPFNDGTIILLEILPEDALRTVIFKD